MYIYYGGYLCIYIIKLYIIRPVYYQFQHLGIYPLEYCVITNYKNKSQNYNGFNINI